MKVLFPRSARPQAAAVRAVFTKQTLTSRVQAGLFGGLSDPEWEMAFAHFYREHEQLFQGLEGRSSKSFHSLRALHVPEHLDLESKEHHVQRRH
jgi:hypothetical protein